MIKETVFGQNLIPDFTGVLAAENSVAETAEWILGGHCADQKGLPELLRVRVISTPAPGSRIVSEVWLPKKWNGLFIGTGNGGMGGGICYGELGGYARDGYAVANTDLGTSGGRDSAIGNPEVVKDFGWRATHVMTVVGKKLTEAYYGETPRLSYFLGGSTGGQQALSEAQRFPEDYDGIVAGVPANNRVFLHTYFIWNYHCLHTENGEPLFTWDEVVTISDLAAAWFSEKTGITRNYVAYPYAGEDTIPEFLAYLKARTAFSDRQLTALRMLYEGPRDPVSGKQIYNGMPIGSERYFCGIMDCQRPHNPNAYPFIWTFGRDYDCETFDYAADLKAVHEALSADLNANDPDLSAFRNHGGKLIAFSGSADACVPYPDFLGYYLRAAEAEGDMERLQAYFRWFLLPGKDHGGGGLGTNHFTTDREGRITMLTAIRQYREDGIAPERLYAFHSEENTCRYLEEVPAFGSAEYPVPAYVPLWDAAYFA